MFIKDMLKRQEGLSRSEAAVAAYILEQGSDVAKQSTRQIADALYISAPSVVRLAQKLGFTGFNEFKAAYLDELEYFATHFRSIDANEPFDERDDIMRVAGKLAALHKETADDTLSIIRRDELKFAVQTLLKARQVVVCASGPQYELARIFRSNMMSIGRLVVVSHSMNDVFMLASTAGADTCFVFVSYSGETEMLLRVARKVAERGLPAFAVTSLGNNSLTGLIPPVLPVTTRDHLRSSVAPFAFTESVLLLFDTLYACVFNYDREANMHMRRHGADEFERLRTSVNPVLID